MEKVRISHYAQGAMYPEKFDFVDSLAMRIGSIIMPGKVKIVSFDDVKKENVTEYIEKLRQGGAA